jgi:predicted RNase H-like HicB family nuclease
MKSHTAAVVERCPETGLFVGYVPGVPGARSQGDTLEEVYKNLDEAIAKLLKDRIGPFGWHDALMLLSTGAATILAFVASVGMYLAGGLRPDTADQVESTLALDIVLGFMFAIVFLLLRVPSPSGSTGQRHTITLAGMLAIWACVSGLLIGHHYEQHRVLSSPMVHRMD